MTSRLLYTVAVIAGLSAPAAAQMPVGNALNGERVFAQCKTCHVTTAGVNRIGPSLHALIGRKAGTVPKYTYSAANKASSFVWTEAKLFEYLEAPRKTMPGTKMAFAGLKKPQDRADVIAWLKAQKG